MYQDFYDLREAPFNITPDPRYLFFSLRHREAYEHILFGISERKGFIQVTGEVLARGRARFVVQCLKSLERDLRRL